MMTAHSAGDRPPTPNLDAALKVTETSEQIGTFVMEYLAEQGIVLAQWMWEQLPCYKRWVRSPDGKIGWLSDLSALPDGDVELDPFDCPCVPPPPEPSRPPHPYKHARWSLVQFHRSDSWINDELARFFGLDPAEMERERTKLLEWVRQRND